MAALNYNDALAQFLAAKDKLRTPGTTWGEYSTRIEECDNAWRALAVAANGDFARPNQEAA